MSTSLQIPISLPSLSNFSAERSRSRTRKIAFLHRNGCSMQWSIYGPHLLAVRFEKDGILMKKRRQGSLVVIRANKGFGFNGGGDGGGGGGGWDKGSTRRVLGNLALAAGLTYLSTTGQLGWILDAIVSIWLLAVLLPIVGLGLFFWYAGRDIVQSSCPNCGNDFQILRSSLNDGVQLCPFCTQPFSVQGDRFVREPTTFSSGRPKTSGQVFNGFSPRSEKGKASSTAVVDIEAEVKDIE